MHKLLWILLATASMSAGASSAVELRGASPLPRVFTPDSDGPFVLARGGMGTMTGGGMGRHDRGRHDRGLAA